MSQQADRESSPSLPKPTGRELEIAQVLWKREPATVREVLDELNRDRETPLAYTTVLRFLQIMTEKGLVSREDGERGHVYRVSVPAEKTKRQLAHDMLERVFAGSAHDMVLHALGGRAVSSEEIREIRELIEKLEGGRE